MRYLMLIVVFLVGCKGTPSNRFPSNVSAIHELGNSWTAFTWNGHQFLQHEYGGQIRTIHICHEVKNVNPEIHGK